MKTNPSFLEDYVGDISKDGCEENLELKFAKTALLKSYIQETKKEFMNIKSLIIDYLHLYNELGKPADMTKLIEIFELTRKEEDKLKLEFPNYPILGKEDIKKICGDIDKRIEKYRFELYSV